MNKPQNRYLRTPEAAEYLGLSTSWATKARLKGTGPKFSKLSRSVIYDTEDLDSWLATHKVSSTSDYMTQRCA